MTRNLHLYPCLLALLIIPTVGWAAEETTAKLDNKLTEMIDSVKKDRHTALKEWAEATRLTVTLGQKVIPPDAKPYHRVSGLTPEDGVHLIIAKTYRPGDQLVLQVKMQSCIWDKDAKRIVLTCEVEKEIAVKPPLADAVGIVAFYLATPKKAIAKYQGKTVTVRGVILRMEGHAATLVLTPPAYARKPDGTIIRNRDGSPVFENQRSLFLVSFSGDAAGQFRLDKGTAIEVTGTITEMKGGVITMVGSQLEK
jgi:hypothetical protein